MRTKKILEEIDGKEIAKFFVVPVRLSKKQEKEAAAQLLAARQKKHAAASSKEILTARLLQLKFQLEDYIFLPPLAD